MTKYTTFWPIYIKYDAMTSHKNGKKSQLFWAATPTHRAAITGSSVRMSGEEIAWLRKMLLYSGTNDKPLNLLFIIALPTPAPIQSTSAQVQWQGVFICVHMIFFSHSTSLTSQALLQYRCYHNIILNNCYPAINVPLSVKSRCEKHYRECCLKHVIYL